ncbi:TetR family transcriptional regulator [Nocardia wallacei]|uniref:TetR family transcriptional regulator n=1 Tax=Nocardia wallacei TaxID=480035 RepID=UPI002457CC51|nr:TetR family transcriptional regulator [Nocardia wallacei]
MTAAAAQRILAAAERLFGEFGIDAVSLRQIAAAAGQRNTSAVAYHYGGKHELVAAIYAWRMADVNARRLRLLDELHRTGGDGDAARLVAALIDPLAETLTGPGEPGSYLRFMAETMRNPRYDPAATAAAHPHADSIRLLTARLRAALPELPDSVFAERLRLVSMLMVTALADRERLLREPDAHERSAIGTAALRSACLAILTGTSA